VDIALFSHKPDEGLGFVSVELIAHEDPFPLGVNADGLLDVFGESHLGAGVTDDGLRTFPVATSKLAMSV
jgi:hypothetical protein